jgi:hypothetical protein
MVDNAAWLAALEGRSRAALRLLGNADATQTAAADPGSALDQIDRDRTGQIARLGLSTRGDGVDCERLLAEGAVLGDAALPVLALGTDTT